jgi:hypothetical protein
MPKLHVELTEEEERLLARLTRERGLSQDDLLHQALALLARDSVARRATGGDRAEVRRRAAAAAGRFRSAEGGSVRAHDDWLAEAYRG